MKKLRSRPRGACSSAWSNNSAVARPARVDVVNACRKTRSCTLLRRSLLALAEQRDPGDLSTLDDPGALEEVKRALRRGADAGS
jgi:propionyl-CoA synthetase